MMCYVTRDTDLIITRHDLFLPLPFHLIVTSFGTTKSSQLKENSS